VSHRSFPALGLLTLVLLVVPATASAQRCVAAPGTAAVDEYCESIPSPDGGTGAEDPASRPTVPVPGATLRRLVRGPDGEALVRVLGHDPQKARDGKGGAPAGSPKAAPPPPQAPSVNPLNAVRTALADGPSLGRGFVAVLLALMLAMVGWGWAARREAP
jgi:hypothetical protein